MRNPEEEAARKADERMHRANGEDDTSYRLKLVPFDEIQLQHSRPWLIKNVAPREGLMCIWGDKKSGKSFWTFDLFMHVALDWEYRGRKVQPGPIVWCAFEGERGIDRRVEAFRLDKLAETASDIPFYLVRTQMDLARDHLSLIGDIEAQIGEVAPVAVVLDTLNRSLGGSESSDEDMSSYVNGMVAIREAFRCTCCAIHHCGHESSRPRGHTSLTAAMDCQIVVKRDRDKTDNIVCLVEYMKDGPEGTELVSNLKVVEVGEDEDGDMMTSCVIQVLDEDEAPQHTMRKDPEGQAGQALEQLRRAISHDGERAPVSRHIPPDIRVVRVTLWRDYFYKSFFDDGTNGTSDRTKLDSKRKAFKRAVRTLQQRGYIDMWDDWVWLRK